MDPSTSHASPDTAIGNTLELHDEIARWPLQALAATLNRPVPDALPPLWHWLYFLPTVPSNEISADGHPKRGGFLPDTGLPRRMWAGGRLTFPGALRPGQRAVRKSTITNVVEKTGRTGRLLFVTVLHSVRSEGKLLIEEEQDIVYRDQPATGEVKVAMTEAPRNEAIKETVALDTVTLFRYSALTFNSHRVHYDMPYTTAEEGYPGLLVHGPLIATLLTEFLGRVAGADAIERFEFKAVSPTFAHESIDLCLLPAADANAVQLWARNARGALAMSAVARLRSRLDLTRAHSSRP
jgi:3-methylfumaryl-CoA hydratase